MEDLDLDLDHNFAKHHLESFNQVRHRKDLIPSACEALGDGHDKCIIVRQNLKSLQKPQIHRSSNLSLCCTHPALCKVQRSIPRSWSPLFIIYSSTPPRPRQFLRRRMYPPPAQQKINPPPSKENENMPLPHRKNCPASRHKIVNS